MRKPVLLIIAAALIFSCEREKVSEIQSKYFLKHYDVDYLEDIGYDLALTPDGGYVFIGTSEQRELNTDIVLIKVDKYGNQPSWSPLLIGGTSDDLGKAVAVVGNDYIIAGSIDGKMALKKINSDGLETWSTAYENEGLINDVAISDNKIYVVGYTETSGFRKPFRAVFDNSGQLIDSSIPPFSQTGDYFTSLSQNGVITNCLGTQFRTGQSNISIIEHGAEGSFSTEETVFNEPQNEVSSVLTSRQSNGFFVIGTSNPIGTGQSMIFIRKLNADYSQDNSFSHAPLDNTAQSLGGSFRGADVMELEDGTIVILGDRSASNDINIILFFLSPNGEVQSSKIFGSTGDQTASSLQITTDKGLILLGNNKYQGNSMITLIKTDSKGEIWE